MGGHTLLECEPLLEGPEGLKLGVEGGIATPRGACAELSTGPTKASHGVHGGLEVTRELEDFPVQTLEFLTESLGLGEIVYLYIHPDFEVHAVV